jgi:hypothetical protein
MPERDFDLLVEIVRRRMGEPGIPSSMGRTLSWTSTSRRHALHVSVMSRNGSTTVHVQENVRPLAGRVFGGIMGGAGGGMTGVIAGIGMGVLHSPAAFLAIELAWLATTYGVARGIFMAKSRKRELWLRQLVGDLAARVEESIAGERGPPAIGP